MYRKQNLRRRGYTSSRYKRQNTPPSLPLFFQPQEVWTIKLPSFTSVWHCCLLRNGIPYTAWSYVGFSAAWATPSFTHPSNQLEVPDPHRDMQWGHQLPLTLSHIQVNDQWLTVLHPNIITYTHPKIFRPSVLSAIFLHQRFGFGFIHCVHIYLWNFCSVKYI